MRSAGIHILELHAIGHTINGILVALRPIMSNNLDGICSLSGELHIVPDEDAILLLRASAQGFAVEEQLRIITVRVCLNLLSGLVPLGETLAGKVYELVILIPVRLEEVVGILLRHMVIAQQTLGIETFLAAGIAVRREVEHVPDKACSHVIAVLNVIPIRFKQIRLVLLVVLVAICVFGTIPREGAVHFRVLVDIGASTIFGKHHRIGTKNLLVVVHLGGQRFNKLLVTVSIRVLHCALETNVEVHASEVNLGAPLCRGINRIRAVDVCLHNQTVGVFLVSQVNKCRIKCNKLIFGYLEVRPITCELLAVTHFILHTPHDDGRVVVSLTNHLCELVRNRILIGLSLRVNQVVRDLAIYQQTFLIGHLIEGGIMRVMRCTNSVHAHIEHGVDVLGHLSAGYGVAHTFTILMVTHTVNFNLFAIQIRLAIGNVERAETDLRAFCIKHMPCGILQGDVHRVQVGIGSAVPTVDVGELLIQLLLCGFGSSANLEIGALLAHDVSGIIRNSCFQNKVRSFHSLVGNIHSCIHRRIVAIKLVVHEDTGAALVLSGNVLVGQCNELNITVDSRELRVIDVNQDGNRINIGYIDGERDGILILHILGQIEDECRITTDMGAHFLTIDLHCGVLVGTVELDEQVLAVVLGNIKLLAVRDGFLIVLGNVRHRRVCVIP